VKPGVVCRPQEQAESAVRKWLKANGRKSPIVTKQNLKLMLLGIEEGDLADPKVLKLYSIRCVLVPRYVYIEANKDEYWFDPTTLKFEVRRPAHPGG
jgi:hypothetical protein